MGDFKETNLWRSTLADQGGGDAAAEPRELLRTSYLRMRERAAELAGEIARDFPELTDHGITHMDALWEMADMIAGSDYEMNPAEAFVFGGAVLVHDLGLATAAYPGGRAALEGSEEWGDAVALALGNELGRLPTDTEIASASDHVKATGLKALLRKRHAEQAEKLGLISWKGKNGEDLFLLDNSELRSAFGTTIGRIGRSHWCSVGDLLREFPTDLTAPVSLPSEWAVDRVSVSCLLRAADASHLDKRRAPELVGAVRSIGPDSEAHWKAQGKLHQPRVKGDRLEYTSGEPFRREEAQAWWTCRNLLKNADRELREVDALLEDTGRSRFHANGVRGVDDPQRLATYVKTEEWLPVDAVIHISDVNRIVEHLGGEQLYGRTATVGLRELIQNGVDAIRARRTLEKDLPDDWGQISVELGEDAEGHWLEVRDNGVGMSPRVLTGVLLDFGESLWRSSEVAHELPGLAGRGFQSIGKFGIGFFSVFMLGERVTVISRRYDRGFDETHVLEFSAGIGQRPLMRRAEPSEVLRQGGTRVRISLRQPPRENDGLLARWGEDPPMTLEELCLEIGPALPVDLEVVEDGEARLALRGEDWQSLEAEELLRRLAAREVEIDDDRIKILAANLRTLTLKDGTVVGRACISPRFGREGIGNGAVVVGGLNAVSLGAIKGIFVGEVLVAARNAARPLVPAAVLASWATEQGQVGEPIGDKAGWQFEFADIVGRCGGDISSLPIVADRSGLLTFDQTVEWIRRREEFRVISWFEARSGDDHSSAELHEDVLLTDSGAIAIISTPFPGGGDWPEELFLMRDQYGRRGADWKLVMACCQAWECAADELETAWETGEYGIFRGGPMSASGLVRVRKRGDAEELPEKE